MNRISSTTLTVVHDDPPTGRISLYLPLSTIDELDHQAELLHLDRDQLLAELIDTALMDGLPHPPAGQSAMARRAERRQLVRDRSRQLAAAGGDQ